MKKRLRKPDPFTAQKAAAQLYIRELTVPRGATLILPTSVAIRTLTVKGGLVSIKSGDLVTGDNSCES